MPWFVLVCNSTSCDYLIAFDTSGSVFLFITSSTIDLLFAWYKRFGANGCFAYATGETFFMPLSRLVFHFLCARTEYFAAAIATRCKLRVVTIAAIDLLSFGTELLVHEGDTAFVAEETGLMPMLLLVR